MARESGTSGFVAARQQAEAMVAHTPNTLDSITAALGLPFEAEAALKAIPVRENLDAVHDGDLLLSDMRRLGSR